MRYNLSYPNSTNDNDGNRLMQIECFFNSSNMAEDIVTAWTSSTFFKNCRLDNYISTQVKFINDQ